MSSSDETITDDSDVLSASKFETEENSDCERNNFQTLSRNDAVVHFIAIFSFSLFIGLFLLQANIAWRSYQSLHSITRSRSPEEVFDLYFDYNTWGLDNDNFDLRVNTSIFIH